VTAISSLPARVDRPAIEVADGLAKTHCQIHTRDYIAGTGFVFTTCDAAQRYLISWTVPDRWRTRRQLRVCHAHGAEFAEANAIALADPGVARASRPAAAPATNDDDPFGGDTDQPYERVRAPKAHR